MRFATVFKPVTIAKASKVRRPNGYARLEALNRRMSSAVQLNLLKGIKTFKKRIDPDALYEAWKTRDYSQVMRVIPWENMDQDLSFSPLGDALESATEIAIPVLPAPLQDTLRFDLANPRIRSYVDARTGDMVTALRQDSQAVIQEAISASFSEALSPRRVADRIKGSIGLYPRLDRAVERYREGLEPLNAEAENNLGNCFYLQEKLSDAIYHYEKAIKIDPNLITARRNLALAYDKAGKK
jgi:tetratricopeptide (TPR) repeat protein